MRIQVLGSAAGGGVPQWNCYCPNCQAARSHAGLKRTQSSVVVSADGKRWVLLNASPDLVSQFASCPPFRQHKGKIRSSPIEAVVLTDGEMDHVAGLFSLREQKTLQVICSRAVKDLISKHFPVLPVLAGYCKIKHSTFPVTIAGLRISALEFSSEKAPRYAGRRGRRGDVVGLKIETQKGKKLVYFPGLAAINDEVNRFVKGCDCLMVDGTFWSEKEMTSLRLTNRTARQMGHIPIAGENGTLAWLAGLEVTRKIYTHINNTNPVLRTSSVERKK
ncbi:MAG TPA: pyrroloquinoline quinone biosynthesis protein PqqB, partial [Candidatus Acidoferrum sp.]|nr:pyrroloquinoline quinone biosynthesis protein PqqB [Candidatus Acidoferrum sp.]